MSDDDERPDPATRDDERPGPCGNQGVVINGGTHYVGNQAVGHRAQAFSGTVAFQPPDAGRRARAAELLADVERLLDEHRAALPDRDAATRELRRLREELDEREPQPPVLRRAVERLTALVQPVTPLVVAIGQLAQAIRGSLGR